MPERCVDRLADAYGDLTGAVVVVLGACYRGGVKETAFSGVFATVERAAQARGGAARARPAVQPGRARRPATSIRTCPGPARGRGRACRPTTPSTPDLSTSDLPGVQVVLDGRDVLDPERWDGVALIRLGRGGTTHPTVAEPATEIGA